MTKTRIVADSTCDLSPELVERCGIELSLLYVSIGGKTYRDRVDIGYEQLFALVKATGEMPKTAAVSVKDYSDIFARYAAAGESVVQICISSEISACYQNACLAARDFDNVHVVDSRNLSTGIGLLVLLAAELAGAGMEAGELAEALRRKSALVEASFVVDTLEYLYKGGRCSAVAALGANLLSLKPCIEVKDGRMAVSRKYKGNLRRCLKNYAADRLTGREDIDLRRVFVTHTADAETAELIREECTRLLPFEEVFLTQAGCTIAGHCGPGTLGVLFMRKEA